MYSRSVGSQDRSTLAFPGIRSSLLVLLLGGVGGLIFVVFILGVSRPIEPSCIACYIGAFRPPLEPYGHSAGPDQRAATSPAPVPALTATDTVSRGARLDGGLPWVAVTRAPALPQPLQGEATHIGSVASIGGIGRQARPGTFYFQQFQAFEPAGFGIVSGAPKRASWQDWPPRGVPIGGVPIGGVPTWSASVGAVSDRSVPAWGFSVGSVPGQGMPMRRPLVWGVPWGNPKRHPHRSPG